MKKIFLILMLSMCFFVTKAVNVWTVVDSCTFLYITLNNGTSTFIYKPNKQNIQLGFDATFLRIQYNSPYALDKKTLSMNWTEISVPTVASSADAYGQIYAMVYACTGSVGGDSCCNGPPTEVLFYDPSTGDVTSSADFHYDVPTGIFHLKMPSSGADFTLYENNALAGTWKYQHFIVDDPEFNYYTETRLGTISNAGNAIGWFARVRSQDSDSISEFGSDKSNFYIKYNGQTCKFPNVFTGNGLKAVRLNAAANQLEFYTPTTGATAFTGLSDVPASYATFGGFAVTVKNTEDGLEFTAMPTQYTDEMAQDAVGGMINGSLNYVDATPLLSIKDADFGNITTSSNGTVWTIDAGSVTNAMLANSTISGIALGANLASLTAGDATLTFSGPYNGGLARTVNINLSNANTWLADQSVPDEAYGVGWNGSVEVPTKNAVYDKIEAVISGGFANTALSNLASVAVNVDLDPGADNVRELGNASFQWNSLWLGNAGFVAWNGALDGSIQVNNAGVPIMSFANSSGGYNFDAVVTPATNDGAALGTTSLKWSDLFLASGSVVNFNSGDVTITHGANTLAFAGASSGYSFDAPTTIGTGNAFTAGTIELGHASNTTISQSAAGIVAVEGVPILKATSGVGNSPTASSTTTITHGLGRAPVIIRIYGMSGFVANAAALPAVHSIGVFTSSGNTCVFQPYDAATITAAEPSATSTTFSIRLDTGVGNFITGVIGNITSTQFDIVWTETGTATAQPYMWESQ